MNYNFYNLAQQEPDLQDVCGYIKPLLSKIEELHHLYENLDVTQKTKANNMSFYLKLDKVIHKYLPELIENYRSFSFDYRNREVIKEEKTKEGLKKYTAKEILLENLATIADEVNILETDFNEKNKVNLLVQKELLKNIGYNNGLKLPDDIQPVKTRFENQFDYKNFKKPEKSIKTVEREKVIDEIKNELLTEIDNKSDEEPQRSGMSLIELTLVLGVITLMVIFMYMLISKVEFKNKSIAFINEEEAISHNLRNVFTGRSLPQGPINEIALATGTIPAQYVNGQTIYSPIGNILIKEEDNNTYTFNVQSDYQECHYVGQELLEKHKDFKINNNVPQSQAEIDKSCATKTKNDIQIIEKM